MAFGQGFPDAADPIHNMPVCNSGAGVKALEFFMSLKPFMPPGVAAYEWDEITRDFIMGRAAMAMQWNAFTADVENPAKSKVVGKTAYCLIPGVPDAPAKNVPGVTPGEGCSSLGGWGWTVNKDSKKKDLAWEFIAFASGLTMSREVLVEFIEKIFAPMAIERTFDLPETTGYKVGAFKTMKEMFLKHLRRRPAIAEETEYEIIVGTEVPLAFIGEKTAKRALDDAAKGMYDLMVRGGYIPPDVPLQWPSKYVNPDGSVP